jgi:Mrp family chromosome partitioning ATPase
MPTKQKKSSKTMPTSYAEINRMHRIAFSNLKGTVIVTSAKNGEGSSLFAHTMALKSAESGNKTLLIDLNMRNMEITKNLELERFDWDLAGLKATLPKKLLQTNKAVKNLSFLSAPLDKESITHLKNIKNIEIFLKLAEKQFDHIIVDTTPVGTLNRYNADPILLGSVARKTILVTLAGVTPKDRIKKALNQLEEGGVRASGIVINDYQNPSLRESLLDFISKFKKLSPSLHNWLRNKIMAATGLN